MQPAENLVVKETIAKCRSGFIAVLVFSLCINLLMLTAPLYMLQVFDRVLSSRSTDTLILLSLIAIVALLSYAGLEAMRGRIMVRLGSWFDRCLGELLLTESIKTTSKLGTEPSVQGLRDLATVRLFLSSPGFFPLLDAPWTPIFIVVLFLLHPLAGFIALGGAVVLFSLAFTNEISTKKLLQSSGGASVQAMRNAEVSVRNADVIEAMGMLPAIVKRWSRHNSEALASQVAATDRGGTITAISKFIRMFLQTAIMGTGAWLVIKGEMTPGAMIAGSILMGRALAPVEQAIGTWRTAVASRDAYKRILRQLSKVPVRTDPLALPRPDGRLEVETLSYLHPGADEPTLKSVGFTLEPGECMALIGPSASGKSTLARLLVGNLKPGVGHVRLDGMDVSNWDPTDLGAHLGYLPQDIELLGGSVKENISRMTECDDDTVIAAAKIAGVHKMILRLQGGYETEIGDGGKALSGGERQRIALARAVFGNPKFIVLDEPNASLDQVGEEALINAIRILKEKLITVVIIAHRPSILRHVDKVLVLQNGSVRNFGGKNEILSKFGLNRSPGIQKIQPVADQSGSADG